jgi:tRNA dimethylallyltransferase
MTVLSKSPLPVIFIMGPTASGKTTLAIDLVCHFFSASFLQSLSSFSFSLSSHKKWLPTGFEIISVDSTMVYQELTIGSAKPTETELALAPHHLIDFISPSESYSVSRFCSDTHQLITDIHKRHHIPLLVGGTMLYFKSLIQGLAEMPPSNKNIRTQLLKQLNDEGIHQLHHELMQVDPISAHKLHINDTQRIMRALEVFLITQRPLSFWHEQQKKMDFPYALLSIIVAPKERKTLHKKIEQRFEQMLEKGLINEIERLYKKPDLNLECSSMRSVGYRQYWQYMQGELTLNEAKEKSIIATRQLAKRQLTWLRAWPNAHWFDPNEDESMNDCYELIQSFVKNSIHTLHSDSKNKMN